MSIAQILNLAVSGLVFLCSMMFVVTYHLMAHWRRTPMGWHLMLFTGAIGCLGLYTIVVTITGLDGTPAMVLRFIRSALLLLVAGLMLQRTWMVWTSQHRPSRSTKSDSGTGDTR
ncbi:hypothetical protein ABZ802_31255 [Streptomyces sp. NPDC047737]|uniref:putative phage holin n=1 Tax=Streptomyces sp. NPDC047737 TaxID=3155740 RepID=UPI0033ED2E92